MAASTGNYVCDNSTLANFKAWAQAISTAIAAGGWTQSTDTGQVNWSSISAVPGSGASVYEVWQPNDGLTNFYLKIQYGNYSGQTNCPTITLTIATGTNGAGTLTGTVVGPWGTVYTSFTAPSSTTTYECRFAAGTGYLSVLMWRAGANNCTQAFAVERSLDVNGNHTSTHVTVFVAGNSSRSTASHQTLHFANGAAPYMGDRNSDQTCIAARASDPSNTIGNGLFGGSIAIDTVAPYVGFFDYALTAVGIVTVSALTEGQVFTSSLYGATRTFIATVSSGVNGSLGTSRASFLCMRWD
jgi:hypothetical protein